MALKIKVKKSIGDFSKTVFVDDKGLRLSVDEYGGGYIWRISAETGDKYWRELENSGNPESFDVAFKRGNKAFKRFIDQFRS